MPHAAGPSLPDRTALKLVQAFHRDLDLDSLIDQLWNEIAVRCGARGLQYRHATLQLAVECGDRAPHVEICGLEAGLGELRADFPERPAPEAAAMLASLVELAGPALQNALAYHSARLGLPPPGRAMPAGGAATDAVLDAPVPPATEVAPGSDALLLVGLDDFAALRRDGGEAWARSLVRAVQERLQQGLRDADGVFQIGEGILAVLLPHTNEAAALDVAAKVRVLIAGLSLGGTAAARPLTACMGLANPHQTGNAEAALQQARQALDAARSDGAGSTRCFRELE